MPAINGSPKPVARDSTTYEVGFVVSIKNYLLVLTGLPNIGIHEVLINRQGVRCLVISLKENQVEALLLDEAKVSPNEMFTRTYEQMTINVGPFLLGRTINPLGSPIDGKKRITRVGGTNLPIYQVAGGIKTREFIKTPFATGVTTVDLLVPVAQGQRELVMGSAKSGKTGFLIDTIINQRKSPRGSLPQKTPPFPPNDVLVVYALIGKPIAETRRLIDILTVNHAMDYTVAIATSPSDPASLLYIQPAVAVTIAEYFCRQGLKVLLILDDLGMHAKFTREINLLSNRSPGRESYPSDIFSQHASIIERAGNFRKEYGGGSITALPVIETSFDDYTSFIPTNLMAMTDGHLMFNANMYHRGIRPAIDTSLSVSRVGRQTQTLAQKILADKVKSTMAQAAKMETLSRFGSEISSQTQLTLNQGKQIEVLLNQGPLTKTPPATQVVMLGLVFTPFLQSKDASFVQRNKENLLNYLQKADSKALSAQLAQVKDEAGFLKLMNSFAPQLAKVCK